MSTIRTLFVTAILCLFMSINIGCEDNSRSSGYYATDYARVVYITIHNYAYGYGSTYGFIDVYIGGAFWGTVSSGSSARIPLELFNDEEVPIRIVLYKVDGQALEWVDFFGNERPEYHINVYDDHVERVHGGY